MTKKITILLTSLIAGLATLLAAVPTGQWTHIPSFTMPAAQVEVSPGGLVYYLSDGALYSYDTVADESHAYSASDILTDNNITYIRYNSQGKYLFISYDNGNIDLLYDDGKVVNISDIRDAGFSGSKLVNGVDFALSRIYIATDFGLVEYDTNSHTVVQSGIYNKRIIGVASLGDHILIYSPFAFSSIKKGENIKNYDNFKTLNGSSNLLDITPLNDSTIVLRRAFGDHPDLHVTAIVYNSAIDRHLKSIPVANVTTSRRPFTGGDGRLYFVSNSVLYTFNDDGTCAKAADLPTVISSDVIGVGKNGLDDVWALDADGISRWRLTSPATELSQKFRPAEMSVRNIASILPSADGSRIYFNNLGLTTYKAFALNYGEGGEIVQQTSMIDSDGDIADVSPYGYEAKWPVAQKYQQQLGQMLPIAPTRMAEDPDNASTLYFATASDGIVRYTDGHYDGRYDDSNSPVDYSWGLRVFDISFDRDGNLWMIHTLPDGVQDGAISMLPAEKRRMSPDKIKKSDWKSVKLPKFTGEKDSRLFICKKSNIIFAFDARTADGFIVIDTKGTYTNLADDIVKTYTSFTDQDGKSFDPGRICSIVEDSRGRVWVGTSSGVFEITSPAKAIESSFTINRLKVPRNDGTTQADYLLGSDLIYDISVDNAGCRWIATEASGLYRVSENGNEILEHYTAQNSMLPSNCVNSVYADTFSNQVFVGTQQGLFIYGSKASPAYENYDNIYAYPNPVRPDYSGTVTIAGLMESSLVKIADAGGNVVAQLRAEGGQAVWDVCNAAGRRVASGIYYVFASSGPNASSGNGAVTKIMVVN